MKLLFLGSTDSYNFALPPLIKKARNRGYLTDVFCTESMPEHTRMFSQNNILFSLVKKKIPKLRKYDAAIYQCLQRANILQQLKKVKIPRFSIMYHLMNPAYVLGDGFSNAHFTFCFGKQFKEWQEVNGIKHSLIPIGSPQYNGLHKLSTNRKTSSKVLIIDTHYYPAHSEGKSQYAEIILKTASKYPKYQFIIKPRTVPDEINNAKHRAEHLYSYVLKACQKSLPNNLILLNEHKDLNQLVAEAKIVVSTWSTAIIPALLIRKPILILKGFKHLDLEYWNNKAVENFYKYLEGTKAVIPFSQLPKKLMSAKPASKKFVDGLYDDFDGNASKKMLDFIEKTLKSKTEKNENVYEINFIYNKILHQYYLPNLRSGYILQQAYKDFQRAADRLRKKAISLRKNPKDFRKELEKVFEESIKHNIDLFIKSDKKLLSGFKGWIINFLFDRKEYHQILKLPKKFYIADYYYFKSEIYKKLGEKEKAKKSLKDFIQACSGRIYIESPAMNIYFKQEFEKAS